MYVQAGLRMCWLCEDFKTPHTCLSIFTSEGQLKICCFPMYFFSIVANNFCDARSLQVAGISSYVLQVFIKRLVFHG